MRKQTSLGFSYSWDATLMLQTEWSLVKGTTMVLSPFYGGYNLVFARHNKPILRASMGICVYPSCIGNKYNTPSRQRHASSGAQREGGAGRGGQVPPASRKFMSTCV